MFMGIGAMFPPEVVNSAVIQLLGLFNVSVISWPFIVGPIFFIEYYFKCICYASSGGSKLLSDMFQSLLLLAWQLLIYFVDFFSIVSGSNLWAYINMLYYHDIIMSNYKESGNTISVAVDNVSHCSQRFLCLDVKKWCWKWTVLFICHHISEVWNRTKNIMELIPVINTRIRCNMTKFYSITLTKHWLTKDFKDLE